MCSDGQPSQGGRSLILIVDDEPKPREYMARKLRALPNQAYEIKEAENIADVRSVLDKRLHDLFAVFLDLKLRGGVEESLNVLDLLRERVPDLSVVVYSAHASDQAQEAIRRGASWYIDKVRATDDDFLAVILSSLKTWELVGQLGNIRAHRDFFQRVIDNIPHEIMVRDREYRVHYENRAKAQRFRTPLKRGEDDCRKRYEIFCPAADCACDKAFLDGKVHRKYYSWQGKAGIPGAELYITASPMGKDPDGQDLVVETARDVSCQVGFLELMQDVAALEMTDRVTVLDTVVKHFVSDRAPIPRPGGGVSHGRIGFTRARAYLVRPRGGFERIEMVCWAGEHSKIKAAGEVAFDRINSPAIGQLWDGKEKVRTYQPENFAAQVEQGPYALIEEAKERMAIRITVEDHLEAVIFADKKGSKDLSGQPDETIKWEERYWCEVLAEHLSAVFGSIYQHEGHRWLLETEAALAKANGPDEVYESFVSAVMDRFEADVVQVHQVIHGEGRIVMVYSASRGEHHTADCPLRSAGHSTSLGVNARACRTKQAQFVENTAEDKDYCAFHDEFAKYADKCPLHAAGFVTPSMAVVPFENGERVVGSVCLLFALRRKFDSIDRHLLLNLGASLSVAFASAERARRVRQEHDAHAVGMEALGELFRQTLKAQSRDPVVRYLLSYLTAQQGLGFHRAVFLRYDEESSPARFVTEFGIGHLDHPSFTREAGGIATMTFAYILEQARGTVTNALTDALRDLAIPATSPLGEACLREEVTRFASDMPGLCDDRLAPIRDHIGVKDFMVVGVAVYDTPFGAFLVDRPFGAELKEEDMGALTTFAAEAGHIFGELATEEQLAEREALALLGDVDGFVGHELKESIGTARHTADAIKNAAGTRKRGGTREAISDLDKSMNSAVDMIDALQSFCSDDEERVDISRVLRNAITLLRYEAKQHSIRIDPQAPRRIGTFQGYEGALLRGFVNVLHNGIEAIQQKSGDRTAPERRIVVTLEEKEDCLRVEITDDGAGMSAGTLSKIRKGTRTTTKPAAGHGFGLGVFSRAVDKNKGTWGVESTEGTGTMVWCSFPKEA